MSNPIFKFTYQSGVFVLDAIAIFVSGNDLIKAIMAAE